MCGVVKNTHTSLQRTYKRNCSVLAMSLNRVFPLLRAPHWYVVPLSCDFVSFFALISFSMRFIYLRWLASTSSLVLVDVNPFSNSMFCEMTVGKYSLCSNGTC